MTIWLERLFLVLIFSLGFMQPALTFSGYRLPTTDLLFVFTAALFVVACAFRKGILVNDTIYKYLIVYIVALALSAWLSIDASTSFVKLAGIVYLVGLTILTINIVSTERLLRLAVLVWVSASTIVCLIGVITILLFFVDRSSAWHVLFLHHYGSLPVGNYPRIQSTFFYPAMLCNYLTVGFLLTLGAYKTGWIGLKTLIAIGTVHCLTAMFTVTPGLGGFLFAAAAWIGVILLEKKRKGLPRIFITAGLAAAMASVAVSAFSIWPIQTSPYVFSFFGMRFDPTQRMLTWQWAWETFLTFPIFGKGIGLEVANVRFLAPSGQMQILTDAHNTWLSVAAQAGVLGLSALIALTVAIIHRSRASRLASDTLSPIRSALLIAFISSFIVQGFVGSFEDARHLWVLIGLIVAASRLTGAAQEAS